jgi:hypothetical protein
VDRNGEYEAAGPGPEGCIKWTCESASGKPADPCNRMSPYHSKELEEFLQLRKRDVFTQDLGIRSQKSVNTRSGNPRVLVSSIFFSIGFRIALKRCIVSLSIQPFSQEGKTPALRRRRTVSVCSVPGGMQSGTLRLPSAAPALPRPDFVLTKRACERSLWSQKQGTRNRGQVKYLGPRAHRGLRAMFSPPSLFVSEIRVIQFSPL